MTPHFSIPTDLPNQEINVFFYLFSLYVSSFVTSVRRNNEIKSKQRTAVPLLFITEGHNHRDVSVIGAASNSFTRKHGPVSHLVHLFIYFLPASVCSKNVSNYDGCFSCRYLGQLS